MNELLTSKPPTFENGSDFLSYKAPAGQTFTSYSPSSDINAYLQAITGLSGWKQRELLQSKYGTEILKQATNGAETNSVSYLRTPGYHSKAACQTDADCPDNQTCYTFNEQVFGPQQGPTCTPTVFPEILLGNAHNNGTPLRQYSNFCYTDEDCSGVDEYTGKPKVGMTCNHYYKGPSVYSNNGLCQVQYESEGRRYNLQQPPGWTMPLQERLRECNTDKDCGSSGINGWSRCTSGAIDGKKYCVWPGQTSTPSPKQMDNLIPKNVTPSTIPSMKQPTASQQRVLSVEAERANNPSFTTGGSLGQGTPVQSPQNLVVEGFNLVP